MPERGGRTLEYLRLTVAALLLFAASWIVLPPPTFPLLILAVGAPELSVWLAAGALLVLLTSPLRQPGSRLARLSTVFAALTIVLAVQPLARFPATARRFDRAMRTALGDDYLCGVPEDLSRAMRRAPMDPVELLRGLRPRPALVTRDVPFIGGDGARLTMDIYRPERPGRYPAIVQIYGGAWQRGAPGDNAAFARYLASRGYAVFAIDYRHAPAWQWPAQLADVRAALRWIGEHGREFGGDPARLVLLGRSSGAQLAMVAAYGAGAPPVRAVVSLYGPVNLEEGYRRPPRPDPLKVRGIIEAFLGGPPDGRIDRYREASPITYTTGPLPPTLLIYAARDNVVEPRFGAMLDERLRVGGTKSVLLEIPWSEHGFDAVTGGPGAQLALYYTERFLAWALWSTRCPATR
jgi:acetyl esterase/lipase